MMLMMMMVMKIKIKMKEMRVLFKAIFRIRNETEKRKLLSK